MASAKSNPDKYRIQQIGTHRVWELEAGNPGLWECENIRRFAVEPGKVYRGRWVEVAE